MILDLHSNFNMSQYGSQRLPEQMFSLPFLVLFGGEKEKENSTSGLQVASSVRAPAKKEVEALL